MVSNEVKEFIDKISKTKYKGINDVILSDIDKFNTGITDMVLKNKVKFESNWSSYTLTNVDVNYEENMAKAAELLDMYGIRNYLPAIKATDTMLIMSYQYSLLDVFNNVIDTINCFHVTISYDFIHGNNSWILIYDND